MSETSLEDRIAQRVDTEVTGALTVSQQAGGIAFRNATEVMEAAKLIAISGIAIPKHLRGNPGACLAVLIQAIEWKLSPYAVANKSYSVNDRLSYESQLIQAVVLQRAPIKGRLKVEFSGEGDERVCRVWADLREDGEVVEYESPPFGKIQPKNSPLWKNDPDQQHFYYSARALCRRHFPDVLLGVYARDELEDGRGPEDAVDITPPPAPTRGVKRVIHRDAEAQEAPPPAPQGNVRPTTSTGGAAANSIGGTTQTTGGAEEMEDIPESLKRKDESPTPAQPAMPPSPKAKSAQPATPSPQEAPPAAEREEGGPPPAPQAGAAKATVAPAGKAKLTDDERTALRAYGERLMGSMSPSGLQRRTAEYFNGEIPDESTPLGQVVQQIYDLHNERVKQRLGAVEVQTATQRLLA